ncbi:MAG: transcriptional regulator [Lachnospiraceae bacterium]|nr:transcriptional regulator [Lachnospiraceae bacterium]
MKQNLALTLDDKEKIINICKALSSPIRIDVLNFLAKKPAIITDVAEEFGIPLSSAALYIKNLEAAGLIFTQTIPDSKGSQRLCGLQTDMLSVQIFPFAPDNKPECLYRESMPVGCYFDYRAIPSCGMASSVQGDIGYEDTLSVFTSPDRFKAQLIWLSMGFLEYRFSNSFLTANPVNRIRFSFEICSEALGYNNNWPSDITVSINGREIGILHSTGDYGDRPGKLNPGWWNPSSTQYGLLRTVEITSHGCYIDKTLSSSENLSSLGLLQAENIRLKLEVKENAEFCGGFNLFGEKFGDYPQNILMEFYRD